MCGGAAYAIRKIKDDDLAKFYSATAIKDFKASGRAETFFWHKNAVLPVVTESGIELLPWGNKDLQLKLPPTGWARQESLRAGKWSYLQPREVDIPIEAGLEKGVWFDMPAGTKGVLVEKDGQARVYMITGPASAEFEEKTGHTREAPGPKQNYR